MNRVFISHSSQDKALAALLVDLLRSSLNLPAEAIICTSVEGHRLAGGDKLDAALLREIKGTKAFIGLISRASIDSAYVLFELGARWGVEAHLLPLLAPDASADFLRGPLAGFTALSCSNSADLHQMVREIANQLEVQAQPPDAYQRRIDEILAAVVASKPTNHSEKRSRVEDSQEKAEVPTYQALPADDYAGAEAAIESHCRQQWPDDYRMRIHCIEEQEKALWDLKRGKPNDLTEEVFREIRENCAKEWPTDLKMRLHCEQEQLESYRELQNRQ